MASMFGGDTRDISTEKVRRPDDTSTGGSSMGGFQAPQTKTESMGRLRGMGAMGEAVRSRFGGGGGDGGDNAGMRNRMLPGRRLGSVRSRFGGGPPDTPPMDREMSDRTEILRRNPLAIGSRSPLAHLARGGRDAAVSTATGPGPAPVQDPYAPPSTAFGGPTMPGSPSLPVSAAPPPAMQPAPPLDPNMDPRLAGRLTSLPSRLPFRQNVYNPYGPGGAFY